MKYFVTIDGQSPIGIWLMNQFLKIGGASEALNLGLMTYPVIYCSAIDWDSRPSFVTLTHVQNPADPASERELVVPHRCILFVGPVTRKAEEFPAALPADSVKH